MLNLRDVHAYYGLSHVLQGVSLDVCDGEIVGLFGRNGVGKTTIIKTVAGWVTPSSGSIELGGVGIVGAASDAICRLGLGVVPEDRRIFPGLTVEENLRLGSLQCPKRPARELRERLQWIYARFPRLGERRHQAGTTLSGGEQQMLAIARVLVGAPRMLLIDEPTEGLAPMIVSEIFAIFASLRDEGIPILLVEQNVPRALTVTTRFYALERGQVIFEGRASSAAERKTLMEAIAV